MSASRENEPSSTTQDICQRVAEVRLIVYGRRGRARFAHDLKISPSTYNYYEKNRVPPPDALARMAEVTSARLEWLITGQGPPFERREDRPAAEGEAPGSDFLVRLERLLKAAPRLARPVGAFVRMLEEMAGLRSPGEAGPPAEPAGPGNLVPVIGGTAAGVARFWGEYGPGGGAHTTIEQRVAQVFGRAPPRERMPAEIEPVERAPAAGSIQDQAVVLIQRSNPDDAGVLEFIEAPVVRARHRQVFGLRVDGDSMAPRYRDGDILLLSPDEPAREGRPAVVKLRGQIGATCKLYVLRGDRLLLVPVNERYPTTEHDPADVEWALAVLYRVIVGAGA